MKLSSKASVTSCLLLGGMLLGCGKKEGSGSRESPEPVGVAESSDWQTKSWPVARGGGGLQGRVMDRVPMNPEVVWTFEADAGVIAEAVVEDGVVYLGSIAGTIYALDAATGDLKWSFEADDTIEGAGCVADGRLLIGSNDGWFRALDPESGEEIWKIEGADKFSSGANVIEVNGETRVLVNGYDGVARCLRLSDGESIWEFSTDNYINGSPAVVDGKWMVFGGCDALLHTVSVETGVAEGAVETDAYITSSVATFGGVVYCGNYGNQVVAADVSGGEPKWVYADKDFPFFSAPAVNGESVFIGSRDRHLHAIDRKSGKKRWKFKTGSRVESSPLLFDDAVVFGSNDGRLYAVSPDEGSEVWVLDLGEELSAPPAFADGTIIIGGGGGTVFAIREKSES